MRVSTPFVVAGRAAAPGARDRRRRRAEPTPGPETDAACAASAVIEIVGPAGAGKSTVVRALGERGAALGVGPRRTRLRTVALAARHAGAWVPPAVELLLASARVARDELRHLVRVSTLHADVLRARAGGPVLLDEGPVFSLARLRGTQEALAAPGGTGVVPIAGALERYLCGASERWAATLDLIVWLDAPDPVLMARIRGRAKPHRMKERPDAEVREFLRRYRRAFEHAVGDLEARGVPVIRLDTSISPAEAVAAAIGDGLADAAGERVPATPRGALRTKAHAR